VVYAAVQLRLPHEAFWSNDGGQKLILVQQMAREGIHRPEIPYDPFGLESPGSFRFAPLYPKHATADGDRLISIVPVYFPAASVPFFRWFGPAGLYLLPLLAGLAALWAVGRLCRSLFGREAALFAVAAAGLGSSVCFYSLTFWEHTLALAGCAVALLLLHADRHVRGRTIAAGVAFALSGWVREEAFLVAAAIGLALLLLREERRRLPWYVLGVAAGLAPFLLANVSLYGRWLGPQAATGTALGAARGGFFPASLADFADRRWTVLRYLLLGFGFGPGLGVLLLGAALAPGILAGRRFAGTRLARAGPVIWIVLLLGIVGAALLRLSLDPDPMARTVTRVNLLMALPILPLALLAPAPEPGGGGFLRLLRIGTALSVLALILGLPSTGGLQWGPRYALVAFPLLVTLAAGGYRRLVSRETGRRGGARAFRIACWLFVAGGMVVQGFGVSILAKKKEATQENLARIRNAAPEVVVTDVWWVPQDNAALFDQIPFYAFYDVPRFERLLNRLREVGRDEPLLVSAQDRTAVLARVPGIEVLGTEAVGHPGMSLFNLYLHRLRLVGDVRTR
jgi:hypothetical protein